MDERTLGKSNLEVSALGRFGGIHRSFNEPDPRVRRCRGNRLSLSRASLLAA